MRKEGLTTSLQQLGMFLLKSEDLQYLKKEGALAFFSRVSGPSILLCNYGPLRMVVLQVMLNPAEFSPFLLLSMQKLGSRNYVFLRMDCRLP